MQFLDSAKRQLMSKAYFQFSGRASRSEYWWFFLFVILGNIVTGILTFIPVIGFLIYVLWSLYIIIPNLAVLCRRMHDSGHSSLFLWLQIPLWVIGGMICTFGGAFALISGSAGSDAGAAGGGMVMIFGGLLCFAAFVFFIITLVLTLLPSTPGPNKFGLPEVDGKAADPQAAYAQAHAQPQPGFHGQPNAAQQPFGAQSQQQPPAGAQPQQGGNPFKQQ